MINHFAIGTGVKRLQNLLLTLNHYSNSDTSEIRLNHHWNMSHPARAALQISAKAPTQHTNEQSPPKAKKSISREQPLSPNDERVRSNPPGPSTDRPAYHATAARTESGLKTPPIHRPTASQTSRAQIYRRRPQPQPHQPQWKNKTKKNYTENSRKKTTRRWGRIRIGRGRSSPAPI